MSSFDVDDFIQSIDAQRRKQRLEISTYLDKALVGMAAGQEAYRLADKLYVALAQAADREIARYRAEVKDFMANK